MDSDHSDKESDHEINLNLSCESSDYDEDEAASVTTTKIAPYQFEPYCSSSEAEEIREGDSDDDSEEAISRRLQRLGNTEWCSCGLCVSTETQEECLCCKEIPEVLYHMQEFENLDCITNHPGFEAVCLNRYNLYTIYLAYNQQYGVQIGDSHERYRYTGYRQFVRWMWGHLGKEIRVILPSCVVNRIRRTYPCPDGRYTGFKAPL